MKAKELKEALDEHYCKEFLLREWFDKPGVRTLSEQMHFTAEYFCEWGRKRMIEEACEWLEPIFKNYAGYNCGMDLVKDFRKAMEEGGLNNDIEHCA
jgi:hypothetical protein